MKIVRLSAAGVFLIALVLAAYLVFRTYTRSRRIETTQRELAALRARHHQFNDELKRPAPPVPAPRPAFETGFYQAELSPAHSFRRMEWGNEKNGAPRVAYIAPLPDLVAEDFVGFSRTDKALIAILSEAGQAKLRAISSERSAENGTVNEAFLVDGQLIYVLSHFGQLRTKSIPITAIEFAEKDFAKRFIEEVSAANPRSVFDPAMRQQPP